MLLPCLGVPHEARPVVDGDKGPGRIHVAVGPHHGLPVTVLLPGYVGLVGIIRHIVVEGVGHQHHRVLVPVPGGCDGVGVGPGDGVPGGVRVEPVGEG